MHWRPNEFRQLEITVSEIVNSAQTLLTLTVAQAASQLTPSWTNDVQKSNYYFKGGKYIYAFFVQHIVLTPKSPAKVPNANCSPISRIAQVWPSSSSVAQVRSSLAWFSRDANT